MKQTAGTLLYRRTADGGVEVLLVHPSGNYNRRAPWSIPKGEPDQGESLEAAARRETREETAVEVDHPLHDLGYADYQKSRKRIFCYGGAAPDNAAPKPASWEVDKAEFVDIMRAAELIHPDQAVFLTRLIKLIEES